MDKTVVLAIVVVVILIGLPLLANLSSGVSQPPKTDVKAPAAKSTATEPPYWNSANLGGTQWTGSFSGISATLTLNPGGTAIAVSDNPIVRTMVPSGQLQGTWSVEGNKFTMEAEIPKMGKKKVTGTISGKQILDDSGKPLPIQQVR